jgi:glycosyltransferase involved in cell wall biosynthesis
MTANGKKRFAVIHIGARMHYAVPALLAQEGMLDRLYTDVTASCAPLRLAGMLWPNFARPKALKRLLGRKLPPEIPAITVREFSLRALTQSPQRTEAAIRREILQQGFQGANSLYSFGNGDLAVAQKARQQGLFVVTEQIIGPAVGRTMAEERSRFPGIEAQDPQAEIEDGIARDHGQWQNSDRVLVPSEFVRNETIELGCDPTKIKLVPYGISGEWLTSESRTVPGLVLFVGTVGLRKGNHYLAQATRLLKQRSARVNVQVVGPVPPHIQESTQFEGPAYLGQIPRSSVKTKFLEADVFVLPTLADSFGLVHLEALACGVPVITTPNCGSVVRDGVEGFIVPIRDSKTLAERILQVVSDRPLREKMSQNARARAAQFTWDAYRQNLLKAFV